MLLKAFGWAAGVFAALTALATVTWSLTGDSSLDIGATGALIPNLTLALYLGYRMIRARIGNLMPFAAAVVCSVPAILLGWTCYQGLKLTIGKQIGPIPVERYGSLKNRNATTTKLHGRLLWRQGIRFKVERGGSDIVYDALPFVPVTWKNGDPIRVYALGTSHRFKPADFDGCGYPKSLPCTLTLFAPRLSGMRMRLIRRGVGPKGGLNFVILRADHDPTWLIRRMGLGLAGGWLFFFTFWLWRMTIRTAREASE